MSNIERDTHFECDICLEKNISIELGVSPESCNHFFCKSCLANYIVLSENVLQITCPYFRYQTSCVSLIEEEQIMRILDQESYGKYAYKKSTQIELNNQNRLHCLTPDCEGYLYLNKCNLCQKISCLKCNFQNDCKCEPCDDLIKSGHLIKCPKCNVYIEKIDSGCQCVRCFICKLDICWLTKQPRWGPNGKGDTSGGCKCGLNNMKCHPDCNNCH